MFRRQPKVFRVEDELFEWFTVTYASILRVVAGLLLLAGGGWAYLHLRDRSVSELLVRAPDARFNWFEGEVKVRAAGTADWVMAARGMALGKHDLVRTQPGAAAEIAFSDGTLVHLRPDSLVSLEATREQSNTGRRQVAWHIASGEVQCRTGPRREPGSAAAVSTPAVQALLGGTSSAAIRVAETGASEFRLFEGTGEVTTRTGRQVELATAQALRVSAEGQLGPKLALPSPPLLDPTQYQAVVGNAASGAVARLNWRPAPAALAYRVMVDHNAAFAWPLVDRTGIKEHAVELRGLVPGRYYWRVAALGRDNLEGAFSEYARLDVVRGHPAAKLTPPPLWVDSIEVRDLIAQVKGRTEPFARVTINGQKAEVRLDGSFNEFVILLPRKIQEVVVQAHGADGGVAERKTKVALPVS